MKNALLAVFSLFVLAGNSQTYIEPFDPAMPSYIGDFQIPVLQDIVVMMPYTDEGDIVTNDFVSDDGATIFGYAPGVVGHYCAVGIDAGETMTLISPEMDFGPYTTNPTLEFRWGQSTLFAGFPGGYGTQYFEVMYKESAAGPWVVVATINTLDASYVWHDEVIDLSGASSYSTFYIGLRATCTAPGSFVAYGQTVWDEIVVHGEGACSATSSTISETAMCTYTVPSGDETYTLGGTFQDTIPNVAGCDSVITIILTINTPDVSVTNSSPILTSNATSSTYQWMDCNTMMIIPGETNQSYTATANGDYAVIVTESGCTDTSACENVTGIGVPEHEFTDLQLYPNPTTGTIFISEGMFDVQLFNSSGVLVVDRPRSTVIDLTELPKGIYLARLTNEVGTVTRKVIRE